MKSKEHYNYMEYLRVISSLAVVMVHVSGTNWFSIEIGSANWIVQTIYNVGARFGVCVFAMISGALLLRPENEVSPRDIFPRYIKRILICYVAWIILYAILYTVLNQGDLQYFVLRLVKLPDHLWYPLMLMGMYLALPLIRLITPNRRLTWYLIWVLIAFAVLNTVIGTTSFFKEMAGDSFVFKLWSGLLANTEEIKFAFVPGYLVFFLLGHMVHEYGLGSWHKKIVAAAVPCLIISGLLTILVSVVTQKYVYTYMLENNPFGMIGAVGIFAHFRSLENTKLRKNAQTQFVKIVTWIGSNTFGIFLIHFAIREILAHYFNLTVASYPAILSVPVNTVLLFVISLGLTALFKKIPGLRRIVS